MTCNEAYAQHRDSCYRCGAVDLGMIGAQRCATGRISVRAAAAEGKRKRQEEKMRSYKLKIKATDIVMLKQMGITL